LRERVLFGTIIICSSTVVPSVPWFCALFYSVCEGDGREGRNKEDSRYNNVSGKLS
jgi:hypothetical protein